MKRICCNLIALLLGCFLLFFTTSCNVSWGESGIENFDRNQSSVGLTRFFIPFDFLELFPYESGDYEYFDGTFDVERYECVLLYTVYDEEHYIEAKTHAMDNWATLESFEEYQGYCFFKATPNVFPDYLPHSAVFFAYSDDKNMLLFTATNLAIKQGGYKFSSISEYFDTYFEFFNFESGEIERESTAEDESTS